MYPKCYKNSNKTYFFLGRQGSTVFWGQNRLKQKQSIGYIRVINSMFIALGIYNFFREYNFFISWVEVKLSRSTAGACNTSLHVPLKTAIIFCKKYPKRASACNIMCNMSLATLYYLFYNKFSIINCFAHYSKPLSYVIKCPLKMLHSSKLHSVRLVLFNVV